MTIASRVHAALTQQRTLSCEDGYGVHINNDYAQWIEDLAAAIEYPDYEEDEDEDEESIRSLTWNEVQGAISLLEMQGIVVLHFDENDPTFVISATVADETWEERNASRVQAV